MKKENVRNTITATKKHLLILCFFLGSALVSFSQYPRRITWGTRDLGQGVRFSVDASINEPSMGMQTVTYRFVNRSDKKVQLNWTTTLTLSEGGKKSTDHEYTFDPGESKDMGGGGEGDIVDIKRDGGKVMSVSIPYNKVRIVD